MDHADEAANVSTSLADLIHPTVTAMSGPDVGSIVLVTCEHVDDSLEKHYFRAPCRRYGGSESSWTVARMPAGGTRRSFPTES